MPITVCLGYISLIIAAVLAVVTGGLVYIISLLAKKRNLSKRSGIKSLLITSIVILIVFCGSFWLIGNYLYSGMYPPIPRQSPLDKDIIGTWNLSEGSVKTIQEEGYTVSTHTLTFRPDKTFEMINLPDMIWNFGNAGGTFMSGSGTWKIVKDINGDWLISMHFTELNIERKDFNAHFYLAGKEPPYSIYDWIGDPDDGRIIKYVRK